jgi:AAA+ superfamily predicted ATPase
MSGDRIESLRRALGAAPGDHALRALLAEELARAGRRDEALEEYGRLLEANALAADAALEVGELAIAAGALAIADACLACARAAGVVEGVAALQARVDEARARRGVLRLVRVPAGGEAREPNEPDDDGEALPALRFDEVGGLADVKKAIHRMIILPFRRADLYERYGRKAGGGVLLYGPPGCGKTLIARATAGECELPFLNVRIEQVLSRWLGESEQNLHAAFERARAKAPCVIFLDEMDALGFARRKQHGGGSRSVVDQLLQELDSIGSDNRNLLTLAATNAPWDVDDALKRPGRFDRVVFVPPPDPPAREAILKALLASRPAAAVEPAALAERTPLWSGADLRALVERATDLAIDEALESGGEQPIEPRHFEQALGSMRASTLDWLARARTYVEFANRDDRYREVADYLRTREVKRHLP